VTPVQSSLTGRVVAVRLDIAREVQAGDVLVELDAEPEQRKIGDLRARLASLGPQVAKLREQVEAEQQAAREDQMVGQAAQAEAQASLRQSEAADFI